MATDRGTERYQGIATQDPGLVFANLRRKGPNPEDSTYTQRAPRPGIPEPDQDTGLLLKASGRQSEDGDIEILTLRAGHPGVDRGGFVFRDVDRGDTTSQYFGRDGYNMVTGWDGQFRFDVTGGTDDRHPRVVRLLDGRVVMIIIEGAAVTRTWRYDPSTSLWADLGAISFASPAAVASERVTGALVELPSGRLLYFYADNSRRQVHALFSDDFGATWAIYATAVLDRETAADLHEIAAGFANGNLLLMTAEGTAPQFGQQWASSDLGGTFEAIGNEWAANTSAPQEEIEHVTVIGLASGQFLLVFYDEDSSGPATAEITARIVDPFSPGYTTTRIQVQALAFGGDRGCTAWQDEDGIIYCLYETGTGASTALERSIDGGANWRRYDNDVLGLDSSAGVTERPQFYSATSTGGRGIWATRWQGDGTSDPESVAVIYLGGWTRASLGIVDDLKEEYSATDYIGWSNTPALGTTFAGAWLPVHIPDAMSWALVQTGGAHAIVSPSELDIDTSGGANTRYFEQLATFDQSPNRAAWGAFIVRLDSGGGLGAAEVGMVIRFTDFDNAAAQTFRHEIEIRLSTAAVRIFDVGAAAQVGVDFTIDTTTDVWIQFAIVGNAANNGQIAVWIGRPDQHDRRLALAVQVNTLNTIVGNVHTRIQWGHVAGGVASRSKWSMTGHNMRGWKTSARANVASWASAWNNPVDLRAIDYSTLPYWLHDGVQIAAESGPTRLAETQRIKTRYDFGIENLHPDVQPSPRVVWRNVADETAERIVWDAHTVSLDQWPQNASLAVVVLNANMQTLHFEGWNGATWDLIATLDAGSRFGLLDWEIKGDRLQPNAAATNVGVRYFWHNEHAGDSFDLGTGTIVRLLGNTEGAWRVDGSGSFPTKVPTLRMGSALASATGAAGRLWSSDFAALIHEYTGDHSRFSIRIPSQSTASGFYQIGQLLIGPLAIFGHQYDLGWTVSHLNEVDLGERRDGSARPRKRGPRRRELDFAWVETAVHARQAQANNPDPDFVTAITAAGGIPIATKVDVIRMLEGLTDQTDGPTKPIVAFQRIPRLPDPFSTAFTLVTQKREMFYGRVVGDLTTENLAAPTGETIDEIERLNTITIREET